MLPAIIILKDDVTLVRHHELSCRLDTIRSFVQDVTR